MSEAVLNAKLAGRRDLNDRYAILRVEPDEQPIPPFVPGQFVQLGLPQRGREKPGDVAPRLRIAKRSYSIASSADDRKGYELLITLVAGGRLTPEIWKLGVGGRCWVGDQSLGSFTLDGVPPGSDLVMVATGSGIAPYVSMLRTYGHRSGERSGHRSGDRPGDRSRWRGFVLIHGVRRASDLAYRDELESRARSDPTFRYLPIVSRDPDEWSGLQGRVQHVLEERRFLELTGRPCEPECGHVFLCGNPEMIQSVRELLAPRGFAAGSPDSSGNLHFEKYW